MAHDRIHGDVPGAARVRHLFARAVLIGALISLLATGAATASQGQTNGVRTSYSNTTRTYSFTYPDCCSTPNYVYTLSAAVKFGTITSSNAVIKSVTWTYVVASSSDTLLLSELLASDNQSLTVTHFFSPMRSMTHGHTYSYTETYGQHFYFNGGYLQLGAYATGEWGASWSTQYLYFVPGNPG